jgi:hypothetical protein
MSIRDVTELVGGQLQFGPMPPLDGNLETIGGQHDTSKIANGFTECAELAGVQHYPPSWVGAN